MLGWTFEPYNKYIGNNGDGFIWTDNYITGVINDNYRDNAKAFIKRYRDQKDCLFQMLVYSQQFDITSSIQWSVIYNIRKRCIDVVSRRYFRDVYRYTLNEE